jgi:GAF domain-containing protein
VAGATLGVPMGDAHIAHSEAVQQRSRVLAEQAALRRVATLAAEGVPAHELFHAVTEEVGRLFGADLAAMGRFVTHGSVLTVAAWAAEGEHPDISGSWPLEGDNLSAVVLRTGRCARQDHWDGTRGPIAGVVRELGIRSSVGSPIVVDGRIWGALLIHSKTSSLPSGTELRMAEFNELVASAIANIELRAAARRLAERAGGSAGSPRWSPATRRPPRCSPPWPRRSASSCA